MDIEWIDGFSINVNVRDNQVTLSANRQGLSAPVNRVRLSQGI